MEGVRQKCRPKHQVLTLKCYPQYQKGVLSVKPNSSELSYLLYYVSTRRTKLTKVCAFLEKRAARDVWRRKIGNVQVTLEILSALIEKVPRDLPIYARSVMTVLDTVLRSREISLVEDSIATFETFCQHQDMAALSAEQDFATQYREVVRTYASFAGGDACSPAQSPPMAIRWKNAGLRAIQGVVSSEAGLAADGGDSLKIILPVIVENLFDGDDNLLATLEERLHESEKTEPGVARRRRMSTNTVETVDTADGNPTQAAQTTADADRQAEMDMRLLALRCLERIVVTGSSRGQIRVTTKVVLEFILRKSQVTKRTLSLDYKGGWETSLIEIVARWCPVQVRFIILMAAMEVLLDTKPTEEALDLGFTTLFMIDWLLKSPVNMIGLSVIDVLQGLLRYMASLLIGAEIPHEAEKQKSRANGAAEPSHKRKQILSLLQRCIGDLMTHVYYGEQPADLMRTILTRVRPSSSADPPPTATMPSQYDGFGSNVFPSTSNAEMDPAAFSLGSAKVTALKAVKNILVVSTSQKSESTHVESRQPVGIYVWEGTQWLLRDPERDVRYAYVDAFLTWLKLETTANDLKVKERTGRHATSPPRRDLPNVAEKPGKRTVSTNGSPREKAMLMAQSNFLRLLHLTIYDHALDSPEEEREIMLLHLLLTKLVDHLGVNAIRFGLPMVLRLQDDMATSQALSSSVATVNVGSLVHGYLWKLSELYHLEAYRLGNDILNEIVKRERFGLWLQQIRLPPASLGNIVTPDRASVIPNASVNQDTDQLTPFRGVAELVSRIEEAYNESIGASGTAHGSSGSPDRNAAAPVLPPVSATGAAARFNLLPQSVKDQMLSSWSREACLEEAEKEKTEATSLSGSKTGTTGRRHLAPPNGINGSPPSTDNPDSVYQGAPDQQRNGSNLGVPDASQSTLHSTSRESPLHVTELRRFLSVKDDQSRRISPLKSRLDSANRSVRSSSSESMVSGYSMSEIDGDGGSVRPRTTRDSQAPRDGDGMETPKASTMSLAGDGGGNHRSSMIPPVPPLPPSLSIPGCFPNESQRELSIDRPSTAPGPNNYKSVVTNGKVDAQPRKSLDRSKSRSSTGLAAHAANHSVVDGARFSMININGDVPQMTQSDADQREDVEKILHGYLAPKQQQQQQPVRQPTMPRSRRSVVSRRSMTAGIGRPPYEP